MIKEIITPYNNCKKDDIHIYDDALERLDGSAYIKDKGGDIIPYNFKKHEKYL